MNYKQVVAHFGGLSKAAEALEIERQNVFNWRLRGRIPSRWQVKIENMTAGRLRADAAAHRELMDMAAFLAGRNGDSK